ncbi:MAG: hypothetical protein ACE5K3_01485 [bacterium]
MSNEVAGSGEASALFPEIQIELRHELSNDTENYYNIVKGRRYFGSESLPNTPKQEIP